MSVGEVFLAAFVQVILQHLSSLLKSNITDSNQLKTDLQTLKRSLEHIGGVLGDVEKSQARKLDYHVQAGLRHLRDVAYDANDVLDEISTEGLRRQAVHGREVRDALAIVNPKRQIFKLKVQAHVKHINSLIDSIRKDNAGLRLDHKRPDDEGVDHNKPTTGILSSEVPVFGREEETRNILELLITDEYSTTHISVIPVQGIGGIGKTTLAQVVYNHEFLFQQFDRNMWVHVPCSSDVTRLTRLILESVSGRPTNLSELHSLQRELMTQLSGRKYLLVLDNLWNERSEEWDRLRQDWDELRKPLLEGARGSRILITTRSPTTAKITSSVGPPLFLHGLPYEDCWSVFAHHAFEDAGECARLGTLVHIGRAIVKKCCGSPLAARTLGSHLRAVSERGRWESFERSEILHVLSQSRDGILSSLESTYHQLPPHLKQCFRFCGIFPKDFKFEKDVLVRLWMAQGFILSKEHPGTHDIVQRVEDVGAEYFDSLVDHLFFRRASDDPSRYVMCDLISELAQFVSHDECCMFQHRQPGKIAETIRHSSLFCDHPNQLPSSSSSSSNQQPMAAIESFYERKGLYTLLLLGDFRYCSMQIPKEMTQSLRRLRTLDLGNLDIEMLDDSIEDLIHLRYLNLSSTRIKGLPESVCNLQNLQTLGLRNCTSLEKLPKHIKYLCNLRHLDLHLDEDFHNETVIHALSSMPMEIGKLNLQTLSRFVVGKAWNCGAIKELGNLNEIHGDLRLLKLHNIDHEREATEARLSDKRHLTRLELQWGSSPSSKQHNRSMEEMVLARLRPYTTLRELWIVGYSGASFPPWAYDRSFSDLVKVKLSNCRGCKQLPPLGLLPSLRELCIKGMDGVERIDCGFCGGINKGFRSLRVLHFENMINWREWHGAQACELPTLRELVIKGCPDLGSEMHSFPTATQVFIS